MATLVAIMLVAFLRPNVFEDAAHSLGFSWCQHRSLAQLENDGDLSDER